jgi:hypothetical protein
MIIKISKLFDLSTLLDLKDKIMELDDFVTETICRIMKGMADADKRLKAEKTGE